MGSVYISPVVGNALDFRLRRIMEILKDLQNSGVVNSYLLPKEIEEEVDPEYIVTGDLTFPVVVVDTIHRFYMLRFVGVRYVVCYSNSYPVQRCYGIDLFWNKDFIKKKFRKIFGF
jgi:hypothetical protein